MIKFTMSLFIVICILFSPILAQEVNHGEPEFGQEEDFEYARKLWKRLEEKNLVGHNMIRSRPYHGSAKMNHGTIQTLLESKVKMNGHEGTVVVLHNYETPTPEHLGDIFINPNKYLMAVSVMYKREQGFDEENADWFWALYNNNGMVYRKMTNGLGLVGRAEKYTNGANTGCIGCHLVGGGADLRFTTPQ